MKSQINYSKYFLKSSTSKYRKVIWRCKHKYSKEEKCQTPNLDEDEIKQLFIKATNQLVEMKAEVMENYSEMKEVLFGTTQLEAEQESLENELNEVAGLIEDYINENVRVSLDQAEYEKRYNALVARFDKANTRLKEVKQEVVERQAKGQQMELFMGKLEKVGIIDKFDDNLFLGLVDVIEISRDKKVVKFKDGSEVEV